MLFEIRIKKTPAGGFFFSSPGWGFFSPGSRPLCEATFVAKVWTAVRFGPGFLPGRGRDEILMASPGNSVPGERRKEQAMSGCGGMDVCLGEGWGVRWWCLILGGGGCISFQVEEASLLFEIRIKKTPAGGFFFPPPAGFFFSPGPGRSARRRSSPKFGRRRGSGRGCCQAGPEMKF